MPISSTDGKLPVKALVYQDRSKGNRLLGRFMGGRDEAQLAGVETRPRCCMPKSPGPSRKNVPKC